MPASRSARAITFAPRSWPSSPGLAMMTRIFTDTCYLIPDTCLSDYRRFLGFAPDLTQGVAHLPHRGIRPHGVDEQRHRVGRPARPLFQRVEGRPHTAVVPHLPE